MTKPNSDNDEAVQREENPEKCSDEEKLRAARHQNPINLLLAMATDDNVETDEGHEIKVEDARSSPDKVLLTKNELQKYEEYKQQWTNMLKHPQEAFDALDRRERQIIQAAKTHDWDTLDKLKVEVESDLERMTYIFGNIATNMQSSDSKE